MGKTVIILLSLTVVKPWPQTLSLKTKTKGPWAYTKILWATTPPHPITFKHEGGVPHQNPKSLTYSEEGHGVVQHVQ